MVRGIDSTTLPLLRSVQVATLYVIFFPSCHYRRGQCLVKSLLCSKPFKAGTNSSNERLPCLAFLIFDVLLVEVYWL